MELPPDTSPRVRVATDFVRLSFILKETKLQMPKLQALGDVDVVSRLTKDIKYFRSKRIIPALKTRLNCFQRSFKFALSDAGNSHLNNFITGMETYQRHRKGHRITAQLNNTVPFPPELEGHHRRISANQ